MEKAGAWKSSVLDCNNHTHRQSGTVGGNIFSLPGDILVMSHLDLFLTASGIVQQWTKGPYMETLT